jgi:pimeloyl-ACP methyl ester carboxylesterase
MADKTLLLPGTQASDLDDAANVEVWNAVAINLGLSKKQLGGRPPDQWQPLLSMAHTPGSWAPTKTSLAANTVLRATDIVRAPYDSLRGMCDASFPYDWRSDIRYNAQLLIDYLTANRPDGGRWNLIGHSQGGLVIVAASKLMKHPDDFAQLVARVILVATPLGGTMRAAEALLFGRDDLGKDLRAQVRAMARTWPALYQMLPSWPAVRDTDGTPLAAGKQLLAPGGWSDASDVDPAVLSDMCRRAREAQALFEGPFSYMGPGVGKLVIMGKQQETPITIVRDGDAMDESLETFEAGDDLVPNSTTLSWGGKPFAGWTLSLKGARDHSMLCEDEEVLDAIRRKLAQPAPKPPTPVIA